MQRHKLQTKNSGAYAFCVNRFCQSGLNLKKSYNSEKTEQLNDVEGSFFVIDCQVLFYIFIKMPLNYFQNAEKC